MNEYLERAESIMERINELASISEDKNCITRRFGTKAFLEGSNRILLWMKEAGLEGRIDNIGNVRGRLCSDCVDSKTFVIASHIDSVINAGKFDGPLGVLVGLDVLQHLIQAGTSLPFNIELVAFSDEEGVRFHTTYLGSKVVAGSFDKNLLMKTDESGETMEEVIRAMGGNVEHIRDDAIAETTWLGYYEVHIEQGPVLYEKNVPVAVVTAIAGQIRAEIIFRGMRGHAGTVPMNMRNDALCGAAECILEIEKFAISNRDKIVATVGSLNIINAASNVIPGEVVCSLDLRSADESILLLSYQKIQELCEAICRRRNIVYECKSIQEAKPVACDATLNETLAEAIADAGYELIHLASGAGHDAVPVSAVAPVAMLFVKCFKGISHNPLENMELNDIAAAIRVSDSFIHNLIKKYNFQ